MDEDEQPAKPVKRWQVGRWLLVLVAVLALLAGWAAWKGPSAALRWAVRSYDPALRLKMAQSVYHEGEWALRGVELQLRGQREPLFEAKEVRVGLGPRWRSGQFGSLRLVEPFLRLDRAAVAHFSGRTGGGGGFPWEIAEVVIERGHLWAENFGDPGLDVSVGVNGVLTSLGLSQGDEIHRLELYDLYVASREGDARFPVMGAGRAELTFNMAALQQGRVPGMRVEDGWMIAGLGLQRLMAEEDGGAAKEPGGALLLESLDLVKMQVQPDGLPGGLPELRLMVNTALRDIPLGSVAGELGEIVHQVEFADVELLSPSDPLRRAVTIHSVFVKFTLSGLARRDLHEVTLLGPTIYVGEPLFEYMKSADDPARLPEPVRESEGWNVNTLRVNFGRVIIAVGGRTQVGLPLAFYTTAENLSLSSLAGLNVELVLKVPTEDYEFPAYDLTLGKVQGDLLFNYPPDPKRNNLVNVVTFERARWRNFRASELWVSATFDSKGINGEFGGKAYRGYVNGGFSFFLQPDSPWTGWLTAQDLDLEPLTADGAPQHLVMDGRADFEVEANGRATVVERVRGQIKSRGKGRMVVNKLNDLLGAMPAEWSDLKRELSRVSLETLRDFDFTEARSDFWFVGRQGMLELRMKGPAGARNLEMVFHGRDTDRRARWQQGGRR
jgi:hypothetical protein